MPRCSVHHHPCQKCRQKTECGGVWEENYDGEPEVICREFHKPTGINLDFLCERCNEDDDDNEQQDDLSRQEQEN